MENWTIEWYNDTDTNRGKFWMITGDGNQPKVRHPSRAIAVKEAERLAKANPGIKFYVLEAVDVIEQPVKLNHKIL
jgi:hypothetical protein